MTRFVSFDGNEVVEGELARPDRYRDLFAELSSAEGCIARGAGLSYCSAAAGDGIRCVSSSRFDRILDFEEDSGHVWLEPGVELGDLLQFAVSRGWYPPVLPGYPSITVGGAVAANVHGKSHVNTGNFVSCVDDLWLFHPDHGEIHCSREKNPETFELTVGGFGLTGFITSVKLSLVRLAGSSIRRRRIAVPNLAEAVECLQRCVEEEPQATAYSWNDLNRSGEALGAGIVYVESFCDASVPQRRCTGDLSGRRMLPISIYNRITTPVMTRAYHLFERLGSEAQTLSLHAGTFPIAGKEIYYSLFGRPGLHEFQMLVPHTTWAEFVYELRRLLLRHRIRPTLGSLKLFDGESHLLAFDGRGVCLAIDTPAGRGSLQFGARLDDLLIAVGGISNVVKDSRLAGGVAARMFPHYLEFKQRLQSFDSKRRFRSALSSRLLLD